MKKNSFSGNLGGKIMIAQQQSLHQKRLNEIYRRKNELTSNTINYDYLMRFSLKNPSKISKAALNDEMNHHLNLKHLIKRLNSPKSYLQRQKDENDFIAHPSLFFRNNDNKMKLKKSKKAKEVNKKKLNQHQTKKNIHEVSSINRLDHHVSPKKKKSENLTKKEVQQLQQSPSVNSQMPHNGLTLEKVRRQLPELQKFDQEDIELFAESLTQIIFKYNLNSMQDIEFLFECVQDYLPQHYPEHFISAIQDMFRQIVTSLNIEQ